jgi:hypothetical protein
MCSWTTWPTVGPTEVLRRLDRSAPTSDCPWALRLRINPRASPSDLNVKPSWRRVAGSRHRTINDVEPSTRARVLILATRTGYAPLAALHCPQVGTLFSWQLGSVDPVNVLRHFKLVQMNRLQIWVAISLRRGQSSIVRPGAAPSVRALTSWPIMMGTCCCAWKIPDRKMSSALDTKLS